ncbi:hypothetical protein BFJ63_vAg16867 [Fusarium oxysporum f. sp. narcissi]|uniref:PiggyBac transposable element-derived protein domain-containing protein n=1 Tax=Fusarium oxysporum f. sp. narcissi TaxID=451672 RepID=A0A4V1RY37_FUSOX|nr:hypothetical protein BFJ63_vAg16867 [Fusarium oxysporum f. sp. narcissi]
MSAWLVIRGNVVPKQRSRASQDQWDSRSGLSPDRAFFLRWLWHIIDATYGPVGIELPQKKPSTRSQGRGASKAAGKELARQEKPIALNPTQGVVIDLANLLPKATYRIFIDKLFSSSGLLHSLRDHGHGATDTARKNNSIYKELAEDKGSDGKVKRSHEFSKVKAIPTTNNKVNHIAWNDNKLVLFMTAMFTGADNERVERQKRKPSSRKPEAKPIRQFFGDEAIKIVQIPTVAAAYNEEMNHVDRGDQLRSCYKYRHPLRRGAWQALCWTFLLDVALVNSYLLQRYGQPRWKRYTNHR